MSEWICININKRFIFFGILQRGLYKFKGIRNYYIGEMFSVFGKCIFFFIKMKLEVDVMV